MDQSVQPTQHEPVESRHILGGIQKDNKFLRYGTKTVSDAKLMEQFW